MSDFDGSSCTQTAAECAAQDVYYGQNYGRFLDWTPRPGVKERLRLSQVAALVLPKVMAAPPGNGYAIHDDGITASNDPAYYYLCNAADVGPDGRCTSSRNQIRLCNSSVAPPL